MKAQSLYHGKRKPTKNNNMGSKPITHRSKSPLRATFGEITKSGDQNNNSGEGKLLGEAKVVDADGYVLNANDSGQTTGGTPAVPEVRRTVLYSDLPESQRAAAREYNMKKFGTHNPTAEGKANNTVVTQAAKPATPGSFERETEYDPVLTEGRDADKVDTFYPWEARFARRTQRASVRDEKRRGRQGERQLNRALKAGVIDQEEYDAEIGQARRMKYGQGNIAQRQIGIDGGIEGTEGFDAITSQGYQANRRNTLRTDMNRRPQGEQEAGMRVKADGTEDMTQAEYEAGGKKAMSSGANAVLEAGDQATPKTSKAVQDASVSASESAPEVSMEDAANQVLANFDNIMADKEFRSAVRGSDEPEKDLPFDRVKTQKTQLKSKSIPDLDVKPGAGYKAPVLERQSSQDMFGSLGEAMELNQNAQDVLREVDGTNDMMRDSYSGIESNVGTGDRESTKGDVIQLTDGVPVRSNSDRSIIAVDESTPAFKMKYKHSPAMMYKSSPAKMWGPSKQANAGKSTGAQNIDNSTPGRPVTQNITRSAKGIVTGKLSQSSAFKMKGFGNGKK